MLKITMITTMYVLVGIMSGVGEVDCGRDMAGEASACWPVQVQWSMLPRTSWKKSLTGKNVRGHEVLQKPDGIKANKQPRLWRDSVGRTRMKREQRR